jgi:threonine/homoserine/homoserine lactone efflux protein
MVSSAMTVLATLYLLYLAYRIATSPSGAQVKDASSNFAMTSTGGFLLGVTNPKAYMAFASLMGSYSVIRTSASADVALKWLLCVAVMIIVDIAWLWAGSALQKANPEPVTERVINVAMGATILFTTLVGLL